ncbi:LamG domain-containing protein [Rufibacter immobilis]|uniref:LamG domain-containing protein n=1 Tax=Rufibacter immobilis TaxID=1348778 RepID=UPI0035EA1906
MKSILWPLVFLSLGLGIVSCTGVKPQQWEMHSVSDIGGAAAQVLGAPQVVQTQDGQTAVAFDGVKDGLLVDANPIAGAAEFSIEVVFKPKDAWPANAEQRFLHIEDPANPNRRILLELRLNNRKQWYADFFLRTETASLTLLDSTKTHPVGEWATMTLTYQNGQVKGYVNGKLEVSGEIDYQPIAGTAKTSLGTRMDKRSWFNGEIRRVRFWHRALQPKKYSDYL